MADFNKITYACRNKDDSIRLKSSSGGMFIPICKSIIDKGGIVFGATFDDEWNVSHSSADNFNDCIKFAGSKYVQSDIGNTFMEAKAFLDDGRIVLFSGTPCQIAGLKKFLGKEYENLLTIDFVCHGVPSQSVWKKYLSENFKTEEIKSIEFRNKTYGWKSYSFNIEFNNGKHFTEIYKSNPYVWGFVKNIFLRPSCYNCNFKKDNYHSDITLADFWGVGKVFPDMDDDKGISAVIVNTEAGNELINSLHGIEKTECTLDDITAKNRAYNHSSEQTVKRKLFYSIKGKRVTPKLKIILKLSDLRN